MEGVYHMHVNVFYMGVSTSTGGSFDTHVHLFLMGVRTSTEGFYM